MKRLLFAIMFVLCAMVAMAQDGKISVKFQGASPNILDFAWAYLNLFFGKVVWHSYKQKKETAKQC